MEIINPCFSIVSNFEVLESLRKVKDAKKKPGLRNLATITYETIQHLSEANSPASYQTRESIEAFLREVRPYQFTEQECMNIVNNPPTSPLHIQLLIEDSEERLTEEQVNDVLEIVRKHIGSPLEDDDESADGNALDESVDTEGVENE